MTIHVPLNIPDVGEIGCHSGGRPRDDAREQAILDAAIELLCEVGYDGFTVDGLAARARASKATIYRRWPGKAGVVVAAIRRHKSAVHVLPDTGSIRDDLIELLRDQVCSPKSFDVAILLGVLRAMREDDELATLMREHVIDVHVESTQNLVRRSIDRHELSDQIDVETTVEIMWSVMFAQLIFFVRTPDMDLLTDLVDRVVMPLLHR